jgi:hypothetical protein
MEKYERYSMMCAISRISDHTPTYITKMVYVVGGILEHKGLTKRSVLCYNRMEKISDIENIEDEHQFSTSLSLWRDRAPYSLRS